MNHKEFDNYLNHSKKDMMKSFNIAKKHYMAKFQLKKSDEEKKIFKQLLECAFNDYLKKKFTEIDNKPNNQSKINMCMSLRAYYENFSGRSDMPTFNMLEVELKRELYG